MSDCQCKTCKAACQYNPGWFMPGEIEKVAEYLDVSITELFNKFIGVNWWEDTEDIFLLAPALTTMTPGTEYPADPRGQCIFFKDGLCSIHAVKPHECREFIHGEEDSSIQARHEAVAQAWKEHQQQIVDLLGHKPVSKEFNPFSSFSLFSLW